VGNMGFKKIKQIKYYTKAASYLKENPIDAIELGFNIDISGKIIVLDHETLRHFDKVRLGVDGIDSIMTALCTKVVEAGDKNGLKIGQNTGTDSTPLEVLKDCFKKDASLEYMMQCLVKEGVYEPVAMYFRNSRIQEFEECPDGVLDVYHRRNCSEGINSYMKDYLGLETHINGKGFKNIDIHATECCIAILAAALTRLQHGIIENISSVAYLI
jgi:hypothetical protein